MKAMLLDMLDQGTESGMDDGLGESGRAARVENVEWVRWRELLELEGLIGGAKTLC